MDIIKSDIITLHGAAISMIGGRPENQDDMGYLDTPLGFLIVVCDGMGGGPGGKTASYIVKHEIADTICKCSLQTSRDHALKMAAARAHQALEDRMKENPALNGMGSTFVAVLINHQSAVIAHSGDSRFYRLHGKKCLFRTQDHSLVAELVRKKVMTEEEARQSPQANVITRGLGSTNNHVPEIDEIPYRKGDRFVLCTDGVWGSMQHQELLKVFTQPKDQQQLLKELSAQVDKIGLLKGGGHDNHTIAMFELEKDSLLKDSFSWKKWAKLFSVVVLFLVLIFLFLWLFFNSRGQKGQSQIFPSGDVTFLSQVTDDSVKADTGIKTGEEQPKTEKKSESAKHKTISNDTSNGYDTVKNSPLLQGLLKMRKGKDSDSVTKQNFQRQEKKAVSNPVETTQKIINSYNSAKVVSKETLAEAQEFLELKKTEIKALFVVLSEQTRNSNAHKSVEAISRVVENPVSWYVYQVPDKKTKSFMLTPKAKEYINKQIERLKELKNKLEKE